MMDAAVVKQHGSLRDKAICERRLRVIPTIAPTNQRIESMFWSDVTWANTEHNPGVGGFFLIRRISAQREKLVVTHAQG